VGLQILVYLDLLEVEESMFGNWKRKNIAIRVLLAFGFAVLAFQASYFELTNEVSASSWVLIICIFPVSFGAALILSWIKYRRIETLLITFPTLNGPIFSGRCPLQDEYDSGVIMISLGSGALVECAFFQYALPVEGICALLWGVAVFTAIRVYVNVRKKRSQCLPR
jgi:hypothetical protein